MTIIPVILAGGIGERFWPVSRSTMPKQLLALTGRKSLLEETLVRVRSLGSAQRPPLIITGKKIEPLVRRSLGTRMPYETVAEPVGKNTAPAVALGAAMVQARFGDTAVMAVLSADHAIEPRDAFLRCIRFAARLAAEQERLIVFGIPPTRPDTGYGYIHVGAPLDQAGDIRASLLRRFVEKPDAATATSYVDSGEYLWNSGMFVWKASVILQEVEQYLPDLYRQVMTAAKKRFSRPAIDAFYRACRKESIDYGIMERTRRAAVVRVTFRWDDVGSWEAVERHNAHTALGTTVTGKPVYESECEGSIVVNRSERPVAAIGLKDVVLVATGDAVLAIHRSRLGELKKHLGGMKKGGFAANLF